MPEQVVEAAELRVVEEQLPTIRSVRASRRVAPDLATLFEAMDLTLPDSRLHVSGDEDLSCWWVEPRAWLVVGRAARPMPQPAVGALITDLTHRYAGFRISGRRAQDLMSSAISVAPSALAPGRCVRTRFAEEIEVLVQRLPGSADYRLLIDVSLANYASAWLRDSSRALT